MTRFKFKKTTETVNKEIENRIEASNRSQKKNRFSKFRFKISRPANESDPPESDLIESQKKQKTEIPKINIMRNAVVPSKIRNESSNQVKTESKKSEKKETKNNEKAGKGIKEARVKIAPRKIEVKLTLESCGSFGSASIQNCNRNRNRSIFGAQQERTDRPPKSTRDKSLQTGNLHLFNIIGRFIE